MVCGVILWLLFDVGWGVDYDCGNCFVIGIVDCECLGLIYQLIDIVIGLEEVIDYWCEVG